MTSPEEREIGSFVEWLAMYSDYDNHNTGRHVVLWTAYVEWHNQIKFDIQGLQLPYVGKTYDEHAAHALPPPAARATNPHSILYLSLIHISEPTRPY